MEEDDLGAASKQVAIAPVAAGAVVADEKEVERGAAVVVSDAVEAEARGDVLGAVAKGDAVEVGAEARDKRNHGPSRTERTKKVTLTRKKMLRAMMHSKKRKRNPRRTKKRKQVKARKTSKARKRMLKMQKKLIRNERRVAAVAAAVRAAVRVVVDVKRRRADRRATPR